MAARGIDISKLGTWFLTVNPRERLIGQISAIEPDDGVIQVVSKSALNGVIRASITMPEGAPEALSLITLPYGMAFGTLYNVALAGVGIAKIVMQRNLSKGIETTENIALAAVQGFGLKFLNKQQLMGIVSCGAAALYAGGGLLNDLSEKIYKVAFSRPCSGSYMGPSPHRPTIQTRRTSSSRPTRPTSRKQARKTPVKKPKKSEKTVLKLHPKSVAAIPA